MQASRPVLLFLVLSLGLMLAPLGSASADPQPQYEGVTGGVNILSTQPMLVCVGDTIAFEGAAEVEFPPIDPNPGEAPLAPLAVINIKIQTRSGQVTPSSIYHPGNFTYFKFTYKATKPGTDMLTLVLNEGVATYQEPIRVQEKCDYDAFLMTVMHFTADTGDELFRSISTVNGTGRMNRDRQGSEFYQGDGTWHLEETVLTKPSHCVQYYMPPLIMNGPFDLDGHLDTDAEMLDVILSFKPNMEKSFYHGNSVCIDEEGERGEGWGIASGGNPSLAAKIETSVPLGGGSNQVELTGIGMEIVKSVGDLDYTATLTIIPH